MAANTTYLKDAFILTDFTVWINNVGKIGESPGFQPPSIKLQTEEFRGGGMDVTVEIPFGIEKIEFEFELHTWDPEVFRNMGWGPGELDCPINFQGYLKTAGKGGSGTVLIKTKSLIKEMKASKVQVGKKTELTVSCVANHYEHYINGEEIEFVDAFEKIYRIGGTDKNAAAKAALHKAL